jgi:hypothetical protein
MGTPTRTESAAATLLIVLGVMTSVGPSVAAAQDACAGFDRKHTITKLGGPNAVGPGGLQTRSELQAYFAANSDEIRSILASQGLGRDVADALLSAVREGTGIRERTMPEGDRLEWMAYRKGGEVRTVEKICLNLVGTAPAFEIDVPVITATETATADCGLEVTTDCRPGGVSTFHVRAAPGAQVALESPTGTRPIIDGNEPSWTGPMDEPYQATSAFAVSNAAMTTETVTTYTFVVPRECVNLSFVGQIESQRPGPPVTCSERRPQPVCPVPPPPTCAIDLDATELHRGDTVGYQVTGEWAEIDLELLHDGAVVGEPALTSEGGTFVVTERGTYTVVGTASNELGDTHSCRASVEVTGSDWIVRPFGAFLMVGSDRTEGAVVPPTSLKSCPCPPDAAYGYDDGYGFGISVERRLGERFGLEARGLYGRLDNTFSIGGNGIGITERDTVDYLDLSVGLNIHLTLNRDLDWYVGPFVGYGDIGGHESLAFARSLKYEPDGAVTFGAQTGLDWPLGDGPWALHGGARYTVGAPDVVRRYTNAAGAVSEQSESLHIDPITVELGVGYRF